MIAFAFKWFLCVALSWGAILYGIKLMGKDMDVIRKHFMSFCLLVFAIAAMTVYAGEKPPYVPPDNPPDNPPEPPVQPTVTNLYFKAGSKNGNIIPYQTPLKEIEE